jgi:hypothetical protein
MRLSENGAVANSNYSSTNISHVCCNFSSAFTVAVMYAATKAQSIAAIYAVTTAQPAAAMSHVRCNYSSATSSQVAVTTAQPAAATYAAATVQPAAVQPATVPQELTRDRPGCDHRLYHQRTIITIFTAITALITCTYTTGNAATSPHTNTASSRAWQRNRKICFFYFWVLLLKI